MARRRSVMARTAPRARPEREQVLETVHRACPACGGRLRYRYDNRHTVTTLAGLVRPALPLATRPPARLSGRGLGLLAAFLQLDRACRTQPSPVRPALRDCRRLD